MELTQIDFSWSGEPGDLKLPDGVTLDDVEDAARLVDSYERYVSDLSIPLVEGDGDFAVMLVLKIYERLVSKPRP